MSNTNMTEAENRLLEAAITLDLDSDWRGDSRTAFLAARSEVLKERTSQADIDNMMSSKAAYDAALQAYLEAKSKVPPDIRREMGIKG